VATSKRTWPYVYMCIHVLDEPIWVPCPCFWGAAAPQSPPFGGLAAADKSATCPAYAEHVNCRRFATVGGNVTIPAPISLTLFERLFTQVFELPGDRGRDGRIAPLLGPGARAWARAQGCRTGPKTRPGPGLGPHPGQPWARALAPGPWRGQSFRPY
jgi:hypothetical protein